jgi:hypothetical protein
MLRKMVASRIQNSSQTDRADVQFRVEGERPIGPTYKRCEKVHMGEVSLSPSYVIEIVAARDAG